MNRGPDYAYDLTDAEQRTLDLLRQRVALAAAPVDVPVRPATGPGAASDAVGEISRWVPRPGRRGWLAAAVSAAAVIAIALAAGLLPIRPGPGPASPPVPPATSQALSTVDTVRQLAAAALRAGPPTSASQTSVVAVAVRKNDVCAENAYEIRATMKAGTGWPRVTLTIDQVGVPDQTVAWIPCPLAPVLESTPPRHVYDGKTNDDGAAGWARLLASVRAKVLLPDLLDPRAIPDGLAASSLSADPVTLAAALDKVGSLTPAGAAGWWTAVTQVLSSPLCPAAVRSTALSLAASHTAGVQVVADRPTDILGRRGITLRVPYSVDGVATKADLTFDQATGALMQRAVDSAPGVFWSTVITAYR